MPDSVRYKLSNWKQTISNVATRKDKNEIDKYLILNFFKVQYYLNFAKRTK